jgi:hypothetical protein
LFAYIHEHYNYENAIKTYTKVVALRYYWTVYNKSFIMNENTIHTLHYNDGAYMGCDLNEGGTRHLEAKG